MWIFNFIVLLVFVKILKKIWRKIKLEKQLADLPGKVVVITGASSGIGEQLAHCFFKHGCRLVLASRKIGELERVKEDLLKKYPAKCLYAPIVLKLDLEDFDGFPKFIAQIIDSCGHIDILINNGGIGYRGNCFLTNIDVDMKVMHINYFAQIALTKVALQYIIKRGSGQIVFMNSSQGRLPLPQRSSYTAAKHALLGFADCLRAELYQFDISVTSVLPTNVNTHISTNAITESGAKYGITDATTLAGLSPQQVAVEALEAIALREKDVTISSYAVNIAMFLRMISPTVYTYMMLKREKLKKR